MNLKDLECYVKMPNYDVSKATLTYKEYGTHEKPLLIRNDLVMDTIVSCHRNNKTDKSTSGVKEKGDIKHSHDTYVPGVSVHDKKERDDEQSRVPEEERHDRLHFFRLAQDKNNTIDKEGNR